MCPLPRLEKANTEAQELKCLDPDIGILLDEFNRILEGDENDELTILNDMVQHLIKCRPCRRHLSETGKYVFAADLFWSGHFLNKDDKVERKNLKAELTKTMPYHEQVKLIKKISKQYQQEPWKLELARIDKFIED